MNFTKVTFLLLILALTYLAVVESRSHRQGRQNGRYKLFKSRLNRRLPEEGRQYRDSYNRRDRLADNDVEDGVNNTDDDYEDIDDELSNLGLDGSNRIFFINKGQTQTTTAAPVTTPPPPDAVPPVGPPEPPPPTGRYFDRPNRYSDYDF